MGNATSLFNLMRNIGGSVGIAMTGTTAGAPQPGDDSTARRQRHRLRSGGAVDARQMRQAFIAAGADVDDRDQPRAYAALFGLVQRQATMVSFVGIFQLLGVLFVALIPLVLLMKRPKRGGGARPPAP